MPARAEIPFPPPHAAPQSRPDPLYVHVQPQWEYRERVHPLDALPTEADLNALGDEGWELVGMTVAGGAVHYYFKRERPG